MKKIEFIDLHAQQQQLGSKIPEAIQRVLDHGKYIMGPEVFELEEKLSAFCGAKHAITCASGTDALLMALMAYNVQPGDLIFVPTFTFVSTAEVVALLGATPCLIDVCLDDYLIDTKKIAESIKQAKNAGLQPKGIIPVDLFGLPADYEKINALAKKEGLFVIGDAAQSFGASYQGRKVGRLAGITTTSFFPAKPLGCYGDGGAIFTDDDEIAHKLRSIRIHGKGEDKYDNVNIGINGRLDTMQAAILLEKLAIFPDEIQMRQEIASIYTAELQHFADTPITPDNATSVWAQYTLKLANRDRVMQRMKELRIPTSVYYPKPLHLQSAYNNFPSFGGLQISESLSASVLSLPIHPYLSRETQDLIIDSYKEAVSFCS